MTSHARLWGRYGKFVASATAKNPVDPFIDPKGYRAYIDSSEEQFRRGVVHWPHGAGPILTIAAVRGLHVLR